jgi:hypothetical protein
LLNELTEEDVGRLTIELGNRNGLVVEHNLLLAAALGCNTNVSLLGKSGVVLHNSLKTHGTELLAVPFWSWRIRKYVFHDRDL